MSAHGTSKGGFTLLELMVAVAIVGVLAAVAVPNYTRYRYKAMQTHGKAQLSALYTHQVIFKNEYDTYHANLAYIGFVPDYIVVDANGCPVRQGAQQWDTLKDTTSSIIYRIGTGRGQGTAERCTPINGLIMKCACVQTTTQYFQHVNKYDIQTVAGVPALGWNPYTYTGTPTQTPSLFLFGQT